MTKMLLIAAVFAASIAAPAIAATDTAPAKPKMMHPMKHGTGTPVIKPAREPSTDKLNQQQLDMHKS